MRAYNGQLSDNQPIRRNLAEKQKQLRELKETFSSMKPQTSAALKESVQRRIRELEIDIRDAERQSATRTAERTNAGSAQRPGASTSPRRSRRPD